MKRPLYFKATRINGIAYVELFKYDHAIAVISTYEAPNKSEWNDLFDKAVSEANVLNDLINASYRKETPTKEKAT